MFNLSNKIHAQAAFCFVCILLFPVDLFGRQTQTLPAWKTSQAALSALADAITVEGFSIRPPKGYSLQTRSGPHESKVNVWVGPTRDDGTRGQVMVLTLPETAERLEQSKLEELFGELVVGLRERRTGWKQSATEKGLINGLVFLRIRWSGRDKTTDIALHGVVYAAIAGETLVQLSSQDIDAHYQGALGLAESSIFTFERGS
jgi:hypothetical protein